MAKSGKRMQKVGNLNIGDADSFACALKFFSNDPKTPDSRSTDLFL